MEEELFTRETIGTLAGSVAFVTIMCAALQKALNFNPKWLALALSFTISIVGVIFLSQKQFLDYFLGVANAFLIYTSALGITETLRPSEPAQKGNVNRTNSESNNQ